MTLWVQQIVNLIETTAPGVGGVDHINTSGTTFRNIVIGGAFGDFIVVGNGENTVLGDEGRAVFTVGILTLVESIVTLDNGNPVQTGGIDTITGGEGADNIIGGQAGDIIQAGNGRNIVMGDSGKFEYEADGDLSLAETVHSADGGVDDIDSGSGNDVILGGAAGDFLDAAGGDNVVLGDSGRITFLDGIVDDVVSIDEGIGGVDDIDTSGTGRDVIVGGAAGDFIDTGDGQKVVLGDSGSIDLDPFVDANGEQDLISIQTTAPGVGGVDRITSGAGTNTILGGPDGDIINAGSLGDNVVLGDNGEAFWVNGILDLIRSTNEDDGGIDVITAGSGADKIIGGQGADEIIAGAGDNFVIGDSGELDFDAAGILATARTTAPGIGGVDDITTGPDDDVLFGGAFGDTIGAGSGHNVVFGDEGIATFAGGILLRIESVVTVDANGVVQTGGIDTITTGAGRDDVVGGQAGDLIDVSDGENVVLGDSGRAGLCGRRARFRGYDRARGRRRGRHHVGRGSRRRVRRDGRRHDQRECR